MAFIIIPDFVKQHPKLTAQAKLLYGDILTLSNHSGYCFANNQYLANIYGISQRAVINFINTFYELGLIEVDIQLNQYSKRQIKPLVTVENEGTFVHENGTNVHQNRKKEKKVHRTSVHQNGNNIPSDGTGIQKAVNERSPIIDNRIDNIIKLDNSEKEVLEIAPTKKVKAEKVLYTLPDDFSSELKETFEAFMLYKKQRKESYKSEQPINLLIKKINEYRLKYSDALVIENINSTMENNYAGIFLKNLDLINTYNKPKTNQKENSQDLEQYFKTWYEKDLVHEKRLGNFEKLQTKLSENFTKLCELSNKYQNPQITALLLFDLMYFKLSHHLSGSTPERKYEAFEKMFAKLDDYQKNKGDIRKLVYEHYNKTKA